MNLTREMLARSWQGWYATDPGPPGPSWLQWVWTTLFCLAIALGFTLLGFAFNAASGGQGWTRPSAWLRWYGVNLVVSLVIGYLIHLMFLALIPLIGPERIRRFTRRQRAAFFTAVPLTGVALGWPLGVWLLGSDVAGWLRWDNLGSIAGSAAVALLISFVFFLVFNAKAEQADAEKRAAEAQLRLLQGQMEPHFLFNTLANVVTLIETEPLRARQMLETFTDYLRSSLGSLRRDDGTVGRELDLAEAYLRLQHLRMEDRLHYTISADAAARRLALPPLLLQPLVENAVLHGLEPQVEGGRIDVEARVEGRQLVLSVADDGPGPDAPARPGARHNGQALANLRERLRGRYGDQASLRIEPTHPGTRATLRRPL
jgi:hypothetical protein